MKPVVTKILVGVVVAVFLLLAGTLVLVVRNEHRQSREAVAEAQAARQVAEDVRHLLELAREDAQGRNQRLKDAIQQLVAILQQRIDAHSARARAQHAEIVKEIQRMLSQDNTGPAGPRGPTGPQGTSSTAPPAPPRTQPRPCVPLLTCR